MVKKTYWTSPDDGRIGASYDHMLIKPFDLNKRPGVSIGIKKWRCIAPPPPAGRTGFC
jgi:hypothetical protein